MANENPTNIAGSLRRIFQNSGALTNGVAGTLAATADPGDLCVRTDAGNIGLYQNTNTKASPTWGAIAAGGVTLDGAYDYGGAGSGKAITVDSGAVALANTAADNNGVLTLTKDPVGAQSGDVLTITVGAQATGAGLVFANTGSGNDVTGSAGWSITNAGALTVASATINGGLTVTGTITGTIASASWATPTFTGVTTFNGTNTINGATTIAASQTFTFTGADDSTIITVTAGDMVMSNGSLSVTNAGDTGTILTLDNSSGNIASGFGILLIDAGGNSAAGSSMIRLAPTGTADEASIGIQFVGSTKTMQAINVDCDSVTNSCVLLHGGGNIADNMGVLKVTADGTIANGGAIVNITGSTAASATAYGIIINCNANNLEALSVEAGLVKFAERVDFASGAAATPSIAFTAATTTGLFYAATFVGISVAAAEVVRVQATDITINTDLDLILQGAGFIDVGATGYIEFGAAPASAGVIRLENATSIVWRNQAGGGDITALTVNASDDVALGADLQLGAAVIYGDTASGGNLILHSTIHATKGFVGIPTGHEGLKVGGTVDRAGTVGDNALHIFNGAAAPAGTLANGITLYSEGGECKVLDAAGNSTTLSPHTDDGDYVIHSFSYAKNETVTIHLEKMLKALAQTPALSKFVEVKPGHSKRPVWA